MSRFGRTQAFKPLIIRNPIVTSSAPPSLVRESFFMASYSIEPEIQLPDLLLDVLGRHGYREER